ncbi:MAG TPA: isoleucine--tRNA ligase, partial [candidate division WOR-3 bacterium]|nr:isoleucine--tRNA ligase [candidate division WOR-3 bacterium]
HTLFNFIVVDLSSFYLDILKDRLYTWGKNSTGRRAAQTVIYKVLKELLITMYPILSFTVEEAWGNLPGSREESVYLADWPSIHDKYINLELKKDFETLMKVRDVVLVAMEKARKEKRIIQDRLEAQLVIETRDEEVNKVLRKFENYLSEIFIVSQVKLDILEDVAHIEEDELVKVGVRHAEGSKCQRCWIWHPEVGKNEKYPDLCPKCVEVMEDVSK